MRGEVPIIRPIVPTPRGDAEWFAQSVEYYIACPELAEGDNDAAQSGTIGSGQETWMRTTVVGPGNVSFRYKMSSVSGDALAFYVDESFKASWSQGSSWPWTGNFAVPSGTHTLRWKYYKYSGSTAGSCWIDAIQWSGGVPGSGGGADWEQITYTYDPSGRRIAKDVDGVVTKYRAACPELVERDGDHCIAEYDANDVQLRKYVYGPCIDEPICMVEAAGSYAGTYYYHFDALGSVVALSDADGDTVQVYEYDVYGQVAASDPNHPNRFMFTGREFDKETGLYYYRARYYNPTIGRFLQTDPAGQGLNWYSYCGNNATNCVDPSGAVYYGILDRDHEAAYADQVTFACFNDDGSIKWAHGFDSLDDVIAWQKYRFARGGIDWRTQTGGDLANGNEEVFWAIQTLIYLGYEWDYESKIEMIEDAGIRVTPFDKPGIGQCYAPLEEGRPIYWSPVKSVSQINTMTGGGQRQWHTYPELVALAHELGHAYDDITRGFEWETNDSGTRKRPPAGEELVREQNAIFCENYFRFAFYSKVPGYEWVRPRPAVGWSRTRSGYTPNKSFLHPDVSWEAFPWWTPVLP